MWPDRVSNTGALLAALHGPPIVNELLTKVRIYYFNHFQCISQILSRRACSVSGTSNWPVNGY